MTGTLILFALLILFSFTDLKSRSISNLIFIPIVGYAVYNHRILEGLIFLCLVSIIGLYDFEKRRFLEDYDAEEFKAGMTHTLYRGGDAKLMTLAAIASPLGIFCIAYSWITIKFFREVFNKRGPLPYAPFLLASSVITFFLAYLCHDKIL